MCQEYVKLHFVDFFPAICEKGHIVTADLSGCQECPIDTYQNISIPYTTTTCEPCPVAFGTTITGATSQDACQCKILSCFYYRY